jgi:3-phosphoshikimate 1-carboxyvinyltransferase
MTRIIHPVKRLKGSIQVPGDKSISHRALLLGALAEGTTSISNLSSGKDVASTVTCLNSLGIPIEIRDDSVFICGAGVRGFLPPGGVLDAGNSGTTIRLLSGILAAQSFTSSITGDASLRRRPMERIVSPLRKMGALIETSAEGTAPLTIHGASLKGTACILPVASAQIKSCVILAGLCARGTTRVTEPALSRDHTERMLPEFGVVVERNGLTVGVQGPAQLKPCEIDVPGDLSSAAFFIAAASIVPDSELIIENVGTNPTRSGIIDVLKKAGGDILETNLRIIHGEPRADLRVRTGSLRGIEISGSWIPQIIDEIPVLAVLATQAEGLTVVRDAKELRIKETDRIAAIADNLAAMGVVIDVLEDGFALRGPQKLKAAEIDSRNDHRISMAFSVAGLVADGDTAILDPECVDISYPSFYSTLQRVSHG